jgi:hypothetical protein
VTPKTPPGLPMDLANMRRQGVHHLRPGESSGRRVERARRSGVHQVLGTIGRARAQFKDKRTLPDFSSDDAEFGATSSKAR